MKNLLFSGGGGAGTEALVHLLSDNYKLHFVDANQKNGAIPPVVGNDCQHSIPFADAPDYFDTLIDLLVSNNIDFYIPGVDEELKFIKSINDILPHLNILAPDPEYIDRFIDKKTMAEVLAQKGLNNPGAYELDCTDELPYPLFAKPRRGRGSRGVMRLDNDKDMKAYLQLAKGSSDNFIAQDLLLGDEYTVMMSANCNGVLCAIVPVYVMEKRGITTRAKVTEDATVIAECQKIHNSITTKGCYNIQLMKTSDGRVIPFEINPRVSTTLCLGIAAGIDPFKNYLNMHPEGTLQKYKTGLTLSRYWTNIIE